MAVAHERRAEHLQPSEKAAFREAAEIAGILKVSVPWVRKVWERWLKKNHTKSPGVASSTWLFAQSRGGEYTPSLANPALIT